MLKTQKQTIRWTGLQQRNNHAGHLIGIGELVDAQGITLPGYTLQIEVKAPAETTRCLYLFSIMRLSQKKRSRVYQLEVAPHSKRTHNGIKPLYGPHEHVGDAEAVTVAAPAVSCDNWSGTLQWFFSRICVTPFDIEDPNCHAEL